MEVSGVVTSGQVRNFTYVAVVGIEVVILVKSNMLVIWLSIG